MISSKIIYKITILLVLCSFEVAYPQTPLHLSTNVNNLTHKQVDVFLRKAESGSIKESQIKAYTLASRSSVQYPAIPEL
jgi:hypothetical protein